MDRIEKIQLLFEHFYNKENKTANHCVKFYDFYNVLEPKDIHEIIHKLEKDGFLTHLDWHKEGVCGNITFEGGLFHDLGGYIKKRDRDIAEDVLNAVRLDNQKTLEDSLKKSANNSILTNWIIAIATVINGLILIWSLHTSSNKNQTEQKQQEQEHCCHFCIDE